MIPIPAPWFTPPTLAIPHPGEGKFGLQSCYHFQNSLFHGGNLPLNAKYRCINCPST